MKLNLNGELNFLLGSSPIIEPNHIRSRYGLPSPLILEDDPLPEYQKTDKDLKVNLTHELKEKEFLEKEIETKYSFDSMMDIINSSLLKVSAQARSLDV